MSNARLFLFDGSGFIYRAYHGIRRLSRRDGFPTNAIFGFQKMMRKVIDAHQPEYTAMVFDTKGPTFRHKMDTQYKANRKPMPDDLRPQIEIIHRLVDACNIPRFALQGYEADDIIATLTKKAHETGLEVVIVSGDKDLMQMVKPGVSMLDAMREIWFHEAEVEAHWGAPAHQVIEIMALVGDNSDNIPGIPGIGPKTAAPLIKEYGNLEELLANTDRIKQPKRRENLIKFADQARMARKLVALDENVPIETDLEALRSQAPNRKALHALFVEMEFTTLARQMAQEARKTTDENAPPAPMAAEPKQDYRTIATQADFAAFLKDLKAQVGFALDTETTHIDPMRAELVGLSFSWQARQAFYLPLAHTQEAAPNGQLDRQETLKALKPLLEATTPKKIGQNLKYDALVLRHYDIILNGIEHDTMLMSHLIYGSTRRHNLDAIALETLGRTTTTFKEIAGTGKKQLRFDQIPLETAAPYACEDADIAWEAAQRFMPQLESLTGPTKLYQEVERPLMPVLTEMEWVGALIDRQVMERLSKDFNQRRGILTEEIHHLAGETFNINSPKQLGEILFGKMGIKGGRRTKTGYSTNVNVLTKLADQGHKLPAKVLDYRTLTKLQSTYTDALLALIHPETGRIHTSYNQAVTLTGRLSSSDPNLQNIPIRSEEGRAIRGAFIAPEGWKLLSADYSQIELRLLAHLGDVPRLKEAFNGGEDIHSATAAEIFDISLDAVNDDQRRMAKTINFGLVYGMSAFGLAKRLEIENYEAQRYMDRYFQRYSGVRQHMDRVILDAQQKGYVETLGGRRCPVPDIAHRQRNLREFAERTAINAPLQGSAADLIKMAMIRLSSMLQDAGLKSRMILQVHDELVLEVPEAEIETVQPLIREAMEGAMKLSIPLVADIGIGQNWAEAH
ncbi:MAG: DNA polymerase I [Magnetococcales bacterium]|nr:DNA polymerase I [Magnetococcales bacterium]